jgi:hypothetical protein
VKKRIILSSFALIFALNNAAFATTNDVVQQLMEKALYNLGSKVIDKFAPYPGTYTPGYSQPTYNYVPPTVNYVAPAPVATTTAVPNSTNPNASIEEQLIPIDR